MCDVYKHQLRCATGYCRRILPWSLTPVILIFLFMSRFINKLNLISDFWSCWLILAFFKLSLVNSLLARVPQLRRYENGINPLSFQQESQSCSCQDGILGESGTTAEHYNLTPKSIAGWKSLESQRIRL